MQTQSHRQFTLFQIYAWFPLVTMLFFHSSWVLITGWIWVTSTEMLWLTLILSGGTSKVHIHTAYTNNNKNKCSAWNSQILWAWLPTSVSLLLLKRLLLKCQRWQRDWCGFERVCHDDARAAVSPIESLVVPLLSVCCDLTGCQSSLTRAWKRKLTKTTEGDPWQRINSTSPAQPLCCALYFRCRSAAGARRRPRC